MSDDVKPPKAARIGVTARMSVRMALALMVANTALPTLTHGQSAPVVIINDDQTAKLKPGQYLWAPEIAPAGPVTIIVSITTQKAYAYRNGVIIGVSTVSTGTKRHPTPTGVFTVLQKAADHVSSIYKGAAMPFMQRLTWGGVAMHGGNLPGYPASHGCVRLPLDFAKALFGVTKTGVTVVITQDAVSPIIVSTPTLLQPTSGAGAGPSDTAGFKWNAASSPTGPVSIVVSGHDKLVVVLRNGIEIGASAIRLDAPIERTSAFTLQSIDAGRERWLRLPMPGETTTADLSAEERARGHLPEAFRANLAAIVVPGTTLLVTPEALSTSGTGKPLTVIEADGRRR